MQQPVVTRTEELRLVCEKIVDNFNFDSGKLKRACIKLLDLTDGEGERILLALKGIRNESDLTPSMCRSIRRIADQIHVPYDAVLNDIRSFVRN